MDWRVFLFALALAAATGLLPAAADSLGDAERGVIVFKSQCSACHQIGIEAENRVGPNLTGIYGRRAGTAKDFSYSKSMSRMGSDGLTWTFETLDTYIKNPKSLVSATRMTYKGLAHDQDRHALLAYLRANSDQPQNIPESEPTALPSVPDLPAEILAIEGDPEYGAYLSSECATCHQQDGTDQGIPSITRWPNEDFVVAMHAYKEKLRPHPVMQMMAGRLSNDEIAALAAYFATLE